METRTQVSKTSEKVRKESNGRSGRFQIVKLEERIAPSHGHQHGSGGRSC